MTPAALPIPPASSRRLMLFGVPVDALDMEQTVARVSALVAEGSGPHQHVVLNAAKVVEMKRNPELKAII